MTSTKPAPLFGQTVGEAQRALRAVLDGVLDDSGITFDTWVALNALATQGPSMVAGALRRDLAYGLQTGPATVSELLDGLQSAHLIRFTSDSRARDGGRFELTPDAQFLHRRLRESISGASAQVLAGIDSADLETTINVLRKVKEQAQASRDRADAA